LFLLDTDLSSEDDSDVFFFFEEDTELLLEVIVLSSSSGLPSGRCLIYLIFQMGEFFGLSSLSGLPSGLSFRTGDFDWLRLDDDDCLLRIIIGSLQFPILDHLKGA
jgi:hypothetical protein